jgi:hypothetical protein
MFTLESGTCQITDGGTCATSPNYPNLYSNDENCIISAPVGATIYVLSFQTENCCDRLTVNGVGYGGTSGPNGVVLADSDIVWYSDSSIRQSGWKICFQEVVVPPVDTINLVTGTCQITDGYGGTCATSPNYPELYSNDETCIIRAPVGATLDVQSFQTENGYDFLTVNGARYDGSSGPNGVMLATSDIYWFSDSSIRQSGWKICFQFPTTGVSGDPHCKCSLYSQRIRFTLNSNLHPTRTVCS